jgi:thiamine biosynthesis lipoprotein
VKPQRLPLLTGALVLIALLFALSRLPEPGREEAAAPAVPAGRWPSFRGEAMSTSIAVTLPASAGAEAAAAAVLDLFGALEGDLSEWREGSPLAEVNRLAGGAPVPAPADLLAVVERALALAETTGGAFDPTWAALWDLWDFRAETPRLPDPAVVERRSRLVDWRRVEVDRAAGTLRLPAPGMKLGLGGIAKGWALDRAAALLRERGYSDFLVVAGGQVIAGGRRGERPWRIGVRDPRGDPDDAFALLDLGDESASTSGDYEAFFVVDGVRYHHILDPATGRPARGLRSATVVAPDATTADALSTALVVLGPERGLALAEELPQVEAVLVDDAGRVLTTAGMASRLAVEHPPRSG